MPETKPAFQAIDHVRHARENGCIKTKSEWAEESLVFALPGQQVTCNGCQRSIWKAGQRPRRRAA